MPVSTGVRGVTCANMNMATYFGVKIHLVCIFILLIIVTNLNRSTMVVYFTVFFTSSITTNMSMLSTSFVIVIPQHVHIGMKHDLNKGDEEVEDEPDIHHLDVRGLREVVAHVDKHCCQHQHS